MTKFNKQHFNLTIFIILICLIGCTFDPGFSAYQFIIKNNSSQTIIVESKTNFDFIQNDTLKPNQICYVESGSLSNMNYHDTLIKSFFKKLNITPINGKIKINPFERKNWVDSIPIEENIFIYNLTITDNKIQPIP